MGGGGGGGGGDGVWAFPRERGRGGGGGQLKNNPKTKIRGFPTRMVYLHYISCLRYTIQVGNPRNECVQ